MMQALLLAFLVLSNRIQVWEIIALNIFIGVVNGFDITARQAFVVELIENREDLSNAIALNSTVFNTARLIGPSIAGILIALIGEGMCFLINGLSYIAVIAALLAMTITPRRKEKEHTKVLEGLKQGFNYTFGSLPMKLILLLLALISLVGMPYTVLMPVFAKNIFHGGPHTLGFLLGSVGVGALSGAIFLAARKSILGLGKIIALTALGFGVGLIIFSLSNILWFSLIMLVLTGACMMIQMASSNTILQTLSSDEMRGRVMSFYTMSFMGFAPFGSLMAGVLASRIGAPLTLLSGGILCIIGALIFMKQLPYLRKLVRPIYIEKGIIKEIADGIQTASNFRTPPGT